jgi:hypothetical protein
MGWPSEIAEEERVFVECSERPRRGRRFDLLVTDRRVAYSRTRPFALLDRVELVETPRSAMRDVELRCENPWLLWLVGAALFTVFAWYFQTFLFVDSGAPSAASLLLPLGGSGCLIGGRHRWVLRWRVGGQLHRVVLPNDFPDRSRYVVANALRAAEDALKAPLGALEA